MTMIAEIKVLFGEWITAVAGAVDAATDRVVRPRHIQMIEGDDNALTARQTSGQKDAALPDVVFRLSHGRPEPALPAEWEAALRGSRLEVLMKSDKVLFRPLEFPRRAVDFLDGMIRAQIDRLTPWTASDAIFGWSSPVDLAGDRIRLLLAATSKARIQPLLQFAGHLGVASLAVSSEPPAGEGGPDSIEVFKTSLQRTAGRIDVPRALRLGLLGGGLATVAVLALAAYLGSSLDAEQQQLQHRIAERRAALRLSQAAGGSAMDLLAKRKQVTPSSVIVLEAISRVLPDSTYATELRIEGDKVQVVGLTQNAPSLIRLMEQSPQFSQATFFAPTTRSQNDPGERFHIEAHIKPYFGSGT